MKTTQQSLNRYDEWSSQVKTRSETRESGMASVQDNLYGQHVDRQPFDPAYGVLDRVEGYLHGDRSEAASRRASPENEGWYLLGKSAIISSGECN